MTVWGLYGVKSDHDKTEVIGRAQASDHDTDLAAAFATNNGTIVTDVSVFIVTDQDDIDRLNNAERGPFTWDGSDNITGIDWTTDDGVKFGLMATRVSGKQPDANDGVIYLRAGQSVTINFEVWNLVGGRPSTRITGGPQGDIPILVDGKPTRLHVDTTAGVSEDWVFSHHSTLDGWSELRCPQPNYVNVRYKTFVPDGESEIVIVNSIEPTEV